MLLGKDGATYTTGSDQTYILFDTRLANDAAPENFARPRTGSGESLDSPSDPGQQGLGFYTYTNVTSSLALAKLNGTQWQFDNNGSFVNFTPSDQHVIIGRIEGTSSPQYITDAQGYYSAVQADIANTSSLLTNGTTTWSNPNGGGYTSIEGGQITTGKIRSTNWSNSKGSELDLDEGRIRLGGASSPTFEVSKTGEVTASAGSIAGWELSSTTLAKNNVTLDSAGSITLGTTPKVKIDGSNGTMKFFTSSAETNPVIQFDDDLISDHPGAQFENGTIRVIESRDFGNSQDAAPVYVEANDQNVAANRTAGYFAIGNDNNANTLWDANTISGKTCAGTVTSRRYMAGVLAEANLNVCPAVPQVTTAIAAYAGASDSYSFYGISGLMHNVNEIQSQNDIVAFFSSDARMKDNIVAIDNPLNKIKQIRGVYFDWNEKGPSWTKGWPGQPKGKKHDVGVIAQEIQKVLPEAVMERSKESGMEGMLAVDYEKIVPLLIEGIKEQQTMIEDLQTRIKKLEGK